MNAATDGNGGAYPWNCVICVISRRSPSSSISRVRPRPVHVTQSTLSHQIKQLETEIGHRLFDRIGKRIVITEAGEQLLGKVKVALSEIDDGLRGLRGSAQQLSGSLRIGVTHTFNVSLLPTCIDTFFGKHPSGPRHGAGAQRRVRRARRRGRRVSTSASPTGRTAPLQFRSSRCATTRWRWWSRPTHPLASRKRIRMVELHRQNLVLSTNDTTTRELLEGWFRSVGAEPVIVVEMNPIAPALALVRRMEIGAIISRQALIEVKDLCIIPIENPTPMRTPGHSVESQPVSRLRRRNRSP